MFIDINVLTIQIYRTDNRWYCLMMCYSFFFFIIINYSHHQTDVAMFVSVTHQSREDPQVLLAMSAGCGWLSLSIFFYREKKKRKDIQHDMTLTRRQLNTTPLNENIIHSNAQTRMIEWQNRIYLFVLCFFFSLFDLLFSHLNTHNRNDGLQWTRTIERGKVIVH